MTDEEFCVVITPSAPQSNLQVTIDESGHVQLSSRLAKQFAKRTVKLGFNQNCTALQIKCIEESEAIPTVFPKNGRKTMHEALACLSKTKAPFPIVFRGIFIDNCGKWRGERQVNPIKRPLPTSRDTRAK